MIPRSQAGTQRPPPPQHIATTGPPHRPLNRPALPSKLSNVRTASQQESIALQLAQSQILPPTPLQSNITQEAVSVNSDSVGLEDDGRNGSNEASVPNLKPYTGNSLLVDEQSPRSWDAASLPSPSPLQPLRPKAQPLPLPNRPAFLSDAIKPSTSPATVVPRGRRDPARRSTGLRAPEVAVALPRGKVADFFPWTGLPGAHPEDVLNDMCVKNGNNDKGQGPNCPNVAAESNTARPALWPSLKNKSGTQMLSILFCQVLDKRQQMGRCTAPSTFKPPPRVTLTDTKREAWLKDLANPEVQLRRLSRTIPHGIRGKVLLDHCISKDIPIARAVWLSKCVGANEIRAFKRKGVSGPAAQAGEVKWIRDWTVCVEQFIEGIIGECGSYGWSRKMNYCVRLATHFFSGNLLDVDHYIDWLLTSLETSTSERLPVWILLTQVYWKHLISQRKRGRRLSEALLAHLQSLMHTGSSAFQSLVSRLQQLISVVAVTHQSCMIIPRTWKSSKDTLKAIASLDQFASARDSMRNLYRRNVRILGTATPSTGLQRNEKQMLIDALDQVQLDGQVPSTILPQQSNTHAAMSTLTVVLQWATSHHRQGMARVYLAARVLRHWNIIGVNTDNIILQALEAVKAASDIDATPLHKIISLLARSGHFSVGKYLQWLISIGALSATSNDAQLLLELPVQILPSHVSNLRRTILGRMGYDVQAETQEFEKYRTYLASLLQVAASSDTSPTLFCGRSLVRPGSPTGTVKLILSSWLCNGLITSRIDNYASTTDDRVFKGGLSVFCVARQVLETFGDFLSLSICVKAASQSTSHAAFLATIADTINMHTDVFAAMGVLTDLTKRICDQQQALRKQLPLDKTFLVALSSLVQNVPCDDAIKSAVAADLYSCELQSSAAACSPASDSMVMTAGGVPETDEDINRILASGNTMDEHLFTRMFGIITDRAIKSGLLGVALTGAWFAQLRRFDTTTFDQLTQSLIKRLEESAFPIQTFVEVTAALVGSGCMNIDNPFRSIERSVDLTKDSGISSRLACVRLELVLPLKADRSVQDTPELYRFQVEQKLFREQHGEDIVSALFLALANGPTEQDYAIDDRVLAFLRCHISRHKKRPFGKSLDQFGSSVDYTRIRRLLDHLMCPNSTVDATTMTPLMQIKHILSCANETSLQSCKLALKCCFLSTPFSADDKENLAQVFQESIEQDSPVWQELMTALDKQLINEIHAWAHNRAIKLMSDFVSSTDSSVNIEDIKRYLTAAEIASSPAGSQTGQPQTFVVLNDHLAALGKLTDTVNSLDVAQASQRQRIGFGLDMLLQLITKHFQSSSELFAASSEAISLTTTLCSLLIHQRLQNQRGILEYILDVTSVIVDDLSTDAMATIVRNLPAFAKNDPRIRYLFGITFLPDSWLALASKVFAQPTTQQTQSSVPSSLPRPSHPLPPRPGTLAHRSPSMSANSESSSVASQQTTQQAPRQQTPGQSRNYELKYNIFPIKPWEIMPDPTPNMGVNDTSLSLGLFQARKVL